MPSRFLEALIVAGATAVALLAASVGGQFVTKAFIDNAHGSPYLPIGSAFLAAAAFFTFAAWQASAKLLHRQRRTSSTTRELMSYT